jgi:hypothetical protein
MGAALDLLKDTGITAAIMRRQQTGVDISGRKQFDWVPVVGKTALPTYYEEKEQGGEIQEATTLNVIITYFTVFLDADGNEDITEQDKVVISDQPHQHDILLVRNIYGEYLELDTRVVRK